MCSYLVFAISMAASILDARWYCSGRPPCEHASLTLPAVCFSFWFFAGTYGNRLTNESDHGPAPGVGGPHHNPVEAGQGRPEEGRGGEGRDGLHDPAIPFPFSPRHFFFCSDGVRIFCPRFTVLARGSVVALLWGNSVYRTATTYRSFLTLHTPSVELPPCVVYLTGVLLCIVPRSLPRKVFDCWFESGSMPYAQLHYPFENKEKFEKNFPADFIAEGLDQVYSLQDR